MQPTCTILILNSVLLMNGVKMDNQYVPATADYMNPSGVKPMDTAFEAETAFVGFLYMAAQYLVVINVVAAWVDLAPISLDPTSQTE